MLFFSEEEDCIEITKQPYIHSGGNTGVSLSCEATNKAGKELVYQWFKCEKKGDKQGMVCVCCHIGSFHAMGGGEEGGYSYRKLQQP